MPHVVTCPQKSGAAPTSVLRLMPKFYIALGEEEIHVGPSTFIVLLESRLGLMSCKEGTI